MNIIEELTQNPSATLEEWRSAAVDLQATVDGQREVLNRLASFADDHGIKYKSPDDIFNDEGFLSLVYAVHMKLSEYEWRLKRVDKFIDSLR